MKFWLILVELVLLLLLQIFAGFRHYSKVVAFWFSRRGVDSLLGYGLLVLRLLLAKLNDERESLLSSSPCIFTLFLLLLR